MRIVKKRRRLSKAKIKYVASWTSRLLKNKQTKKISLAFPVQAVIKFAVFFLLSFLLKKKGRKKRKIDTFLFFFYHHHLLKKAFRTPQFLEDIYSFTVGFFLFCFFEQVHLEKRKQHLNLHGKRTLYSYLLENKYNKTVQKGNKNFSTCYWDSCKFVFSSMACLTISASFKRSTLSQNALPAKDIWHVETYRRNSKEHDWNMWHGLNCSWPMSASKTPILNPISVSIE